MPSERVDLPDEISLSISANVRDGPLNRILRLSLHPREAQNILVDRAPPHETVANASRISQSKSQSTPSISSSIDKAASSISNSRLVPILVPACRPSPATTLLLMPCRTTVPGPMISINGTTGTGQQIRNRPGTSVYSAAEDNYAIGKNTIPADRATLTGSDSALHVEKSRIVPEMVNSTRGSTDPFQGWKLGSSSRPQQDDEGISPTDDRGPEFFSQSVSTRDTKPTCLPKSMPPKTSSASTSDDSIDLRDSAGPSSLAFKDLEFHPTSKGKGKASVRNASFQSEQGTPQWDEQTSQKDKYKRLSLQHGIPVRAPAGCKDPSECGGWNNGKSLSETFAYYVDTPHQKGVWSSLVQRKSRRLQDEPPEPGANNKHAKAALCEKVIRNGGTHTATGTRNTAAWRKAQHGLASYGVYGRPYRIGESTTPSTAGVLGLPVHSQQQCPDPRQHSRVARCELPVKSCLHCTTVASCSGTSDHDDHGCSNELSDTPDCEGNRASQPSSWKKIWSGIQRAFS
nr:hypothetical protein CFP56_20344 [Quercus suber]